MDTLTPTPEIDDQAELMSRLEAELGAVLSELRNTRHRLERLESNQRQAEREWRGVGDPPQWWGFNLAEKLALAQSEMTQPPKAGLMVKYQNGPKIPYVTNDDLMEVIRPALAAWGITLKVDLAPFADGSSFKTRNQKTRNGEQTLYMVKLSFIFTDGNEEMSAHWLGEGSDLPIASTFCEKYYLQKRFLLGGGDADDELAESKVAKPEQPRAAQMAEARKRGKKTDPPKTEPKPAQPDKAPNKEQKADPKAPAKPKTPSPLKGKLWELSKRHDAIHFPEGGLDAVATKAKMLERITAWSTEKPGIVAVNKEGQVDLDLCSNAQFAELIARYEQLAEPDPETAAAEGRMKY